MQWLTASMKRACSWTDSGSLSIPAMPKPERDLMATSQRRKMRLTMPWATGTALVLIDVCPGMWSIQMPDSQTKTTTERCRACRTDDDLPRMTNPHGRCPFCHGTVRVHRSERARTGRSRSRWSPMLWDLRIATASASVYPLESDHQKGAHPRSPRRMRRPGLLPSLFQGGWEAALSIPWPPKQRWTDSDARKRATEGISMSWEFGRLYGRRKGVVCDDE